MARYYIDNEEADQDVFERLLMDEACDATNIDDWLDNNYDGTEIAGRYYSPSQIVYDCDSRFYDSLLVDEENNTYERFLEDLEDGEEHDFGGRVFRITGDEDLIDEDTDTLVDWFDEEDA